MILKRYRRACIGQDNKTEAVELFYPRQLREKDVSHDNIYKSEYRHDHEHGRKYVILKRIEDFSSLFHLKLLSVG